MSEQSDRDVDELADRLFEAGRAESVPAAARARALAAIGLEGASAAPVTGGGTAFKAWLKWGGLAALALGVGAAVIATRTRPPPAAPAAIASQPAPPAAPLASAAPPLVATPPAAPTAQELVPPAPSAAPSAARRSATVPSGSADADALARELAALDRARAALRGGDPSSALGLLRDYDRAHPRGALRNEALLLRVEALVRSGRKAEAERLAAPVIASNPDGLAARRLKGLLE